VQPPLPIITRQRRARSYIAAQPVPLAIDGRYLLAARAHYVLRLQREAIRCNPIRVGRAKVFP